MGRKPTRQVKQPSFFKVLLDDFANHLSIPHKFTKKHIPPSLGKCALSGPCGKRSVKLERRKDGLFFHKHGWHCFVKDHLLQFGDFLIFRYDGKKKFKVKIYDRTCCEIDREEAKMRNGDPNTPSSIKDYRFARVIEEIVDEQETKTCCSDNENGEKGRRTNYMSGTGKSLTTEAGKEASARTIIFKSAYSCFKANITSTFARYRIFIPKEIVDTKGLRSKETIDVEDSTGRLWHVKLNNKRDQKNYSYSNISRGWRECSKANSLVVGDVVVFEFVEESVMRLHVFRKGVKARGGDNRPISVVLDAPNIKN